jgi:hypothetical protein
VTADFGGRRRHLYGDDRAHRGRCRAGDVVEQGIPADHHPSSPVAARAEPTRRLRTRGRFDSPATTAAALGRAAGSGSVIPCSNAARSRGSPEGTTGLR